jgi:hypothetical protein
MNAIDHIKTRCRAIGDGDIEAVADLLGRGFPGRSKAYWARGLRQQGQKPLPPECPRYGFMLEADGRPVGAILLLYQVVRHGEGIALRCNLSSWYVEPQFSFQAPLLISLAIKRKDVTYVNISPARHTWQTIEAQNFVCYAKGQFFAIPSLTPGLPGVRVHRVLAGQAPAAANALPEAALLRDHAALGCLSFVVETPDEIYPFVFLPFRLRAGHVPTPCQQLIYCRSIESFVRFAGPLGRALLRRAAVFVMMDAEAPVPGLIGFYRDRMSPKYFRGPDAPRLGDLAYTERVLYGP